MWKTYAIIICFYAAVLSTPGDAKTYTVRSNDCARTADLPLIIAGGDVVAVDLNRGRATSQNVLVIYDSRYDGWASQRLFARFALDPQSARSLGESDATSFEERRLENLLCGAGVVR